MKKLLLSAAAILLCGIAGAQTTPLRIIAMGGYVYNGAIMRKVDSAQFIYLPGNPNGGTADDFNKRALKCDTNTRWGYDNGFEEKLTRTITKFNAAGQSASVLQQICPSGTNVWQNSSVAYHDFNAAGNIIHTLRMIWLPNEVRWDTLQNVYTTYSGLNITEVLRVSTSGDTMRTRHSYVASNLTLTLEEDNFSGTMTPFQRTKYSYDASGNNDTLTWGLWNGIDSFMNGRLEIKTYTGKNIKTNKNYVWQSSPDMWVHNYYNSYAYNAAGKQITDSSLYWSADSNRYYRDRVLQYTYNTAGLNDTAYTHTFNVSTGLYLRGSRAIMEYNTKAAMLRKRTEAWDGTKWQTMLYDVDQKYYYAPEATAVVNTQKPQATIDLYPNPAGNTLYIAIQQAADKACVISICNSMGALVQQWQEAAGNVQRSIATTGFENGMYILTVRGEDGSRVSKQFVVSH